MKLKKIHILCFFCLCTNVCLAQIKLKAVSRVDTTQKDIKAIFELFKNYLNSRPDSVYDNPYWNDGEKPVTYRGVTLPADRFYYANYWAKKLMLTCKPTILAIEKAYNSDKYIIRTLINLDSTYTHSDSRLYDPFCTTRYYVGKTTKGWKLENCIKEETKAWDRYQTKYINYIYPCDYAFHKDIADRANSYCDSIVKLFGIDSAKRFDYYLATSEEQMARLYNMDFWGSPVLGYTEYDNNQIVSARHTEYHIHEFTHLLLPHSANAFIEEGKATYFAGPGGESFNTALLDLSKELKNNDTVTFSDIYNQRYFHWHDSYPSYVTGAVVCKFVKDKKGIKGFKELLKCEGNSEDDFDNTVLKILGTSKKNFEKEIMDYIKGYAH